VEQVEVNVEATSTLKPQITHSSAKEGKQHDRCLHFASVNRPLN